VNKELLKELKALISKIKKVNNQTPNKIDALNACLHEYKQIIEKLTDFNGYRVDDNIEQIHEAKNGRKNVGKKSLHKSFLWIKDDALFKIEHNYSWLKFEFTEKGSLK
jgi:uncharacterized coiled-coil DUF342 family protein